MPVRRLALIPHSRRKSIITRSLCTFAHHTRLCYSSVGAPRIRARHAGKTDARREFHASSTNMAEIIEQDHYKILELPRNATADQIKQSYFKLSKKYHPDLRRQQGYLDDKLTEWDNLTKAYNTLRDTTKRRQYDKDTEKPSRANPWYQRATGVESDQHHRPEFQTDAEYYAWIQQKQEQERRRAGGASHPSSARRATGPHPGTSSRMKLKREKYAAGEAGAGAHAANQRPLEMGFRPRSSWDPRFAKFFDDWAAKMKEHGWDPTKTTVGGPNGPTGPEAARLMDGALLAQYIRYARQEGKDPLGGLFSGTEGRGSAAGIWLKNRMAALDREEAKKAGGAWERGGVRRGASALHTSSSKRSVYSSDTGEDTFNAPWDSAPPRGFQKDVPRPWWATGASSEGKDPHAPDSWSANPELKGAWGKRSRSHPSMLESNIYGAPGYSADGTPEEQPAFSGPRKRDYSGGHQLDERYEEDKLRMAANERRMLSFVGVAVGLGAIVAAMKSAA